MEATGVALAILPLLLNQLDDYVQGLQTLKSFRSKRYRRTLYEYFSNIGTQHTLFLNTLERILDGVVEYEDDIDELINNPSGGCWQRVELQKKLENKLGRSYAPFMAEMNQLSGLLQDLKAKLNFEDRYSEQGLLKDRSVIEREARKLRDILAKSIYADLLSRINATNILLRKLQKDSEYPSRPRRQTPFRRPLLRCGKARKSAHSLHNSIIGGKCWKCSCKSDHKVHFILSYPSIDNLDSLTKEVENPCFGLVLAFRAENSAPESYVSTCQLQAESEFIQSSIGLHHICLSDLEGNPSTTGNFGKQKGVQLPLSKTGFGDPSQTLKRLLPPITDICATISTIISEVDIPKSLGWLADTDHRHHITYVNRIGRSLRSKSLEDLIMASSNFSEGLTSEVFIFSQVDRLRIAVNLACSVLQFHGSWLKNGWKSRDIMFGPQITTGVGDPYVPWNVGANFEDSSLWGGTAPTLIRNRILFPLGIVLVKLSLCQSMENVREPDDSDQTEEHANLKTATRLLPRVEELSGPEYAEVADRCLSWHGRKETSLEAKEMQEEIFKLIIWPLIENLRVFTIRGLGA